MRLQPFFLVMGGSLVLQVNILVLQAAILVGYH